MSGQGGHGAETANALAELDLLAALLDSRWRIPGTSIRFGLDALVGLVPVLGDAATGIVSAYIVFRARKSGAANGLVARMLGNVVLDTVVGSVPILGSMFDVYFKANNRNIRLLRRHLDSRAERSFDGSNLDAGIFQCKKARDPKDHAPQLYPEKGRL